MINTRPTREEILAGIGYLPPVFPESVPAEVRDAEDRELQDYLVGWALDAWDHVTAYEATHQKVAGCGDLAKHSYGCTMVDIDPAGDIGAMMAELRGEIDPADLGGDGLEAESHVTVRYGILPGTDLAGLRQYLRSLEPFEVRFGMVSSFPPTEHSDNAAVLKVDVISPVFEEINAAIAQHASFRPANFEYHSHATLAYVKPEAVEKYVGNDLLAGQTMEVTSIAITMPGMPRDIVPLLGEPAPWHDEPAEKFLKYSEDQARDEGGRWTSGSGAAAGPGKNSLKSAIHMGSNNPVVAKVMASALSHMADGGMTPELMHACGVVKVVQNPPREIARELKAGATIAGCYKEGHVWLNHDLSGDLTPDDQVHAAIHEYGHHMEQRLRLASVQKTLGMDRVAFKASLSAAQKEFREFQQTNTMESFSYAITDRHEWHAKAVRMYFAPEREYHEGLRGWAPKTYALWDGVVKGRFKATSKVEKSKTEMPSSPRLTGGRTAEGWFYDRIVKPEAHKVDLVATEHRCNKRRAEQSGVTQARHEIQATLQHFFTKTANAIAATIREYQKVAKASGADSLINPLPGIDWEGVVPSLAINLKKISKAGAARAISHLNIDASRMISDINEVAADWAEQRAAEMVGMRRLPSGKLVQNPDAQWNITDKTRDELQEIITEAFEKKTSMTELASEIQQAGAFSEYRAALIAKNETIRAENQGNLAGWKTSGQVEMIDIMLSGDHDDGSECECSELAANGPYPVDDVPELPAHPGCECDYVVAQLVGQ